MIFCDQPLVEQWSPDFSSSGLPNPVWTRVKFHGAELCNSLEWTEWNRNPVQVQICDACGTYGCASGGYVHVSAVQNTVLWTVPQNPQNDRRRVLSGNGCREIWSGGVSARRMDAVAAGRA